MADDLDGIVTSHIDGLMTIKQGETELQGLIEKASTRKDNVPEAVYQRVVRDYEARIHALEAEAKPLREQARAQFARLVALHRRGAQALEKAELDRQEVEFRHEVGEFGNEEYETRIGAARKTVEGCKETFDRAEALRQRFLEVVPDEPVVPEPAAPATPEPVAPSAPAVVSESTGPVQIVAPRGNAGAAASTEGTASGTSPIPAPPPATHGAAGTGEVFGPESGSFATVAISPAVLVEDKGPTYKLGALTSIGRIGNNTIVIPVREVSRNHAQIVLTDTGYLLKDLESGNGTFVNGQRIREWKLKEDDRVQIGDRSFTFKSR